MNISFECYCPTVWGQMLYIVGSIDELGKWDTDKAVQLSAITSDKWKISLNINTKSKVAFEYRYFMKDENQNALFYEFGNHRNFKANDSRFVNVHVKDLWRFHGNQQYVWTKSAYANVIFGRANQRDKKYSLPVGIANLIEFKVEAPRVGNDYSVAITGNCVELGNWGEGNTLKLNDSNFPEWKFAMKVEGLPKEIEYKYVIINKKNGEISTWEDGYNRKLFIDELNKDVCYQVNDGLFRFPDNSFKKAGVAIPVFSIRTNDGFGVGEFIDLKKMVDWAKKANLQMIQVLPVNDTISAKNFLDSYPYKAISVFALHPLYLNIFNIGKLKNTRLMQKYLDEQKELNQNKTVDYNLVLKLKLNYTKQLFNEKKSSFLKSKAFIDFFKQNKSWLEPYAAFSFLRDKFNTSDFSQWNEFSNYSSSLVKKIFKAGSENYNELAYWYFIQYYLDKQLSEASQYARNNGIVLKGDIPIGISRYSVDAWCNNELFHFDGQAGAPPDDFSVDGQNWGFPTYNWKQMKKNNYKWWRKRLTKMGEYFDAYRIDHILGFFRIWEIPIDAVQGVLGHFRPSIPITKADLNYNNIWFDYDRLCKPYIRGHFLHEIFGDKTDIVIKEYLIEQEYNIFELKNEFATQRLIYDYFVGNQEPESLSEHDKTIMWGLISLAAEVILLPADGLNEQFHLRIAMHSTRSFNELDDQQKYNLNNLYIHYFYHRHEQFWKEQAMEKLPALVDATNMLVCGEDLGMIPASVPEVMSQLDILSLEIQRMPKDSKKQFAHPADAPIMSVCTPSTHDMSTIRGWWEEDRDTTQIFYHQQLGEFDEAPFFAESWICKEIIVQHLNSPAMWTVFPFQDLLAMDGDLRREDTHEERINEPANPRNYWRYRMHLSVEDLIKAEGFNKQLANLIEDADRNKDY